MIPHGTLKRHQRILSYFQQVIDVALSTVAYYFVVYYSEMDATVEYHFVALVAGAMLIVVYQGRSIYSNLRLGGILNDALMLAKAWAIVVAITASVVFLGSLGTTVLSHIVTLWALAGFVAQALFHLALRVLLREMRSRGYNTRRALLIGSDNPLALALAAINGNSWLGINVAGYVADETWPSSKSTCSEGIGCPHLGGVSDIATIVAAHKIDLLCVALPNELSDKTPAVLTQSLRTGAAIYLFPNETQLPLVNWAVRDLGGIPLACLSESPLLGEWRVAKWVEDKVLGTILFSLSLVPILVIALGVKCSSRGPVLFTQRRHGVNGTVFDILKFRTMKTHEEPDGIVTQARKNDPRTTLFGRFLRRFSLDELPQLFNVLSGHMSLVGPRPHAVEHNRAYEEQIMTYILRHQVKPGMTGWAQVNGYRGPIRHLERMKKRIEYDLYYINNWSVWLDVKILFMTVWCVLSGKNAV